MSEFLNTPFFGLFLSIFTYLIAQYIQKKCKSPLLNPLMISIALIVLFLSATKIPLSSYQTGGDLISVFLAPATAVLAVSIYRQIKVLRKNCIPIIAGCLAGSLASMGSVFLLCQIFGLDEQLTYSLLPKSVTTPIAMEISSSHGGTVSITVAAVVVTGIIGAVAAPFFIKLFRVRDSVAVGVAIGSCSHALGTTKALQIGEVEGAMSSIAIGVSGIITVLISLFL